MKLRNKNTGEIIEREEFMLTKRVEGDGIWADESFHSIAEITQIWEDAPEPLIKDEKIRKAVRAWWNIQENPFKGASVLCKSYAGISNNKDHDGFYNYCIYGYVGGGNINLTATDFEFRTKTYFEYDRDKDYTLEELCGEY